MPSIFDTLLNPETEDPERNAALVAALKRQQSLGALGTLMGVEPTMRVGEQLTKGAQTSFGEALQQQQQARAAKQRTSELSQQQQNWQAQQATQQRQWQAEQKRLQDVAEQGKWQVVTDPVTGQHTRVNPTTGETQPMGAGGGGPQEPQLFNTRVVGKPTEQMRNDVNNIRQIRATVSGAVRAVEGNKGAFGLAQGGPAEYGGRLGEAMSTWLRDPKDTASRAFVFNNVSGIINKLSGAAVSPAEYSRLMSFLPAQDEGPEGVIAKFNAFLDYLDEKEAATRGYTPEELGRKPRLSVTGEAATAAPGAPPAAGGGDPEIDAAMQYLRPPQ